MAANAPERVAGIAVNLGCPKASRLGAVVELVLDQRAEAGVVEARGDNVDGDEEVRHLAEPVGHLLERAAL
jgi:predicted secreted protein